MTMRAGRQSRNAVYILIAAKGGDTTTLSGAAAVKLKNLRGKSPVKLQNLFPPPLNPLNPEPPNGGSFPVVI